MNKITLYILTILSFTSCNKYLDVKSDATLTVPSNIKDLQGLLDDAILMNFVTPSFGETSSDDYYLTEEIYNSLPVEFQHDYTWIPRDYNYENDWSLCYKPVYNANYCLEQIEKIERNADNTDAWNNVKGSALFYRSFYFLNLCWIYSKGYDDLSASSDLGIVLRLSSDFNQPSKRASVKDCYNGVLRDIKEAIPYLPKYASHVMRPSKAAAYGLLARTFLSMRDYSNAHLYSDSCLQLNNELLNFNNPSDVNLSADMPFSRYNKETVFYSSMNASNFLHGADLACIDTLLYNGYLDGDLRREAYFFENSSHHVFRGSYSGSQYEFFSGIAVDEMYLIRSEASAKEGHLAEAMDDLNRLMYSRWDANRTYIPMTAIDINDALNKIRQERRKELLMRGIRWIDLKRLNKDDANISITRFVNGEKISLLPNEKRYALPLPSDIIRLTGMPQN